MSVPISVSFKKTIPSGKSAADTYAYCANIDKNIARDFPGLETLTKVEPNTYRWVFEKLSYGGAEIRIQFVTRFSLEEPHKIRATPASQKSSELSQLTAEWKIDPEGTKAKLTFGASFEGEINVPFFLKAMAGPIATSELSKIFDRYLSNVAKALSS